MKENSPPYVSRGGLKLERGLKAFGLDPLGFVCLDVGISTGGFTDCLLRHGARKIYGVDVGYGQVAWRLRNDPRVVLIERQNVRFLTKEQVPEPVDLCVIDVAFISLGLVFPAVAPFVRKEGSVLALVKPQFELPREDVARGGVVWDPALHCKAVGKARRAGELLGWIFEGSEAAPIRGAKGNQEFLCLFRTGRE